MKAEVKFVGYERWQWWSYALVVLIVFKAMMGQIAKPSFWLIADGLILFYLIYSKRIVVGCSPTGVRLPRLFHGSNWLRWNEIPALKSVPSHELGEYLFVGGYNILPLFLKDQQGFYDYVCQHAPANNPLRLWIEELPGSKAPIFE